MRAEYKRLSRCSLRNPHARCRKIHSMARDSYAELLNKLGVDVIPFYTNYFIVKMTFPLSDSVRRKLKIFTVCDKISCSAFYREDYDMFFHFFMSRVSRYESYPVIAKFLFTGEVGRFDTYIDKDSFLNLHES